MVRGDKGLDDAIDWSYGVIIDAGSTGSRLFLYKWQTVSDNHLIDIHPALDHSNKAVVKKASPGLSSFANTPQNASGKWEGIYSWIAVNYILGRFDVNGSHEVRQRSVGMIDVGGASLQIAIELNHENDMNDNYNVENVNLGCRDDSEMFRYRLFATTFLGYGVNEGIRKYEQLLSDRLFESYNASHHQYVRDSCLPKNLVKTVSRKNGSQFVRKGVGDWDNCLEEMNGLLDGSKSKECATYLTSSTSTATTAVPSCYLGQVRSPHIDLSSMELYGFSELWFTTNDIFSLGGQYNFADFATQSRLYCNSRWSAIQLRKRQNLYPKADEDRLRSQCFKSAWIAAILHKGFSLSKFKNRLKSVFDINGEEVQWTLGAMLHNMRYFPLRDMQRRNWLDKRRHLTTTNKSSIYVLLMIALCIILGIIWKSLVGSKNGLLRREPSIWGYMMLSQDQSSLYQPSASALYKLQSFS
ncbi:unnamed protein product [Anisakis simplex]|uniref:Guanosine-diphosphatase, putative (inferred by orthology to a S. mansoni protein) n=1 Tax=Anisakis simplex TaxID=6269 RepID=A0A0M3JS30_ANISI|nr:unnamed protein product [Anisakis simplex]